MGHVDNSGHPLIDVNIKATLVVPANAKGPVPLLMLFGRSELPAPAQPPAEDLEKIKDAIKQLLVKDHPEFKDIFDKYPAYNPDSRADASRFWDSARRRRSAHDAAVDRRRMGLYPHRSGQHPGG